MAPEPAIRGMILAAGFGTRLAPITDHVPKPLLPVGDATLLDHAVAAFDRARIREIAVNGHHLGPMIEKHLASRPDTSRFSFFPEKEILGTGGALHGAAEFLGRGDHFVVFNGDVLCDVDLKSLVRNHLDNGCLATLLLVDRPRINTVHTDGDGSVVHITGAGPLDEDRIPNGLTAGTYSGIGIFSREILSDISSGFSSLIAPLVRAMVRQPESVKGWMPKNVHWDDLGTLPRLLNVTMEMSRVDSPWAYLGGTPRAADLPLKMNLITGHGSDRRFWRMGTPGWSAVAMQSSGEDPEFPRQLAIGEFLRSQNLGSPEVYSSDLETGTLLMEDLGQGSLFLLARNQGTPPPLLADRYRQVVDHLIRLQSVTGEARRVCPLAVDRRLDEKGLLWETDYFKENFLAGHLGYSPDRFAELDRGFQALAACVARQPLVLLHRDFQSQNIHFKNGEVRLVDIQGLRLGPLGYDIMSLVMDPYVKLPAELVDELLDRFAAGGGHPAGEVVDMALAAGLQRLMQALGAYGFLGHRKGKQDFLAHIPHAVENLRSVLEKCEDRGEGGSPWLPPDMSVLSGLLSSFISRRS